MLSLTTTPMLGGAWAPEHGPGLLGRVPHHILVPVVGAPAANGGNDGRVAQRVARRRLGELEPNDKEREATFIGTAFPVTTCHQRNVGFMLL
jgi:hypothetical protein